MIDNAAVEQVIRSAAKNAEKAELRQELASFTSRTFLEVGDELRLAGSIFGPDRKNKESPFGYGTDEVVGVGVLLRLSSELISGTADLFADGRSYAAAALLRQLVEVEYLAWAFEVRDKDAERWLRSSKQDRMNFFAPAKLRKAADGKFRGEDYGYHCDMGGHPTPQSRLLLREDEAIRQLLMSDLLGHCGRIWDHLLDWSLKINWVSHLEARAKEMSLRYREWKEADILVDLPPPP